MSTSRRDFLRHAVIGVLPATHMHMAGMTMQDTTAKQGRGVSADPLADPYSTGRQADSTGPWDNNAGIIAIERRLRCRCGCTLDVYTCRTTDFTCTYSPVMHREVIALVEQKKTPEEVIQAFIASDGEQVLMAPVASGFNIAGYVVPGIAVTVVGLLLAAYLSRRRTVALETPGAPAPITPVAGSPDQAQLDQLKRALDEVES